MSAIYDDVQETSYVADAATRPLKTKPRGFCRRLGFLVGLYFRERRCARIGKIVLLITTQTIVPLVSVFVINPLLGVFLDATVHRDAEAMTKGVLQATVGLIVVSVLCTVSIWLAVTVALEWREAITTTLVHRMLNTEGKDGSNEINTPNPNTNLNPNPNPTPNPDRRINTLGNTGSPQRAHLFYTLCAHHRGMDNSDQRLTDSVRFFCDDLVTSVFGNFENPFALYLSLLSALANVYGISQHGWFAPTAAFAFACLIALGTWLLMIPVSNYTYLQDKAEGDFRFTHNLTRTFGESIAFYGGEQRELIAATENFESVYSNNKALLRAQFFQRTFMALSVRATNLFGAVVIFIMILSFDVRFDGIKDFSTALLQISGAVAGVVTALYFVSGLAPMGGNLRRISELFERMQTIAEAQTHTAAHQRVAQRKAFTNIQEPSEREMLRVPLLPKVVRSRPRSTSGDDSSDGAEELVCDTYRTPNHQSQKAHYGGGTELESVAAGISIELRNVTIATPASDLEEEGASHRGRILCRHLDLLISTRPSLESQPTRLGEESSALALPARRHCVPGSLLIVGPSGCGKSSLLRVIAGLWPVAGGAVRIEPSGGMRVGRGGVFFLPQSSYTTLGTLREQVLYPAKCADQMGDDETLVQLLGQLELSFLVERFGLDTPQDWASLLSGGEQQRLGFARLFYHRPALAIMDESTSALDLTLERKCLEHCVALGIVMVSVAHRPSVLPYHDRILQLDSTGSWSLRPITEAERSASLADTQQHEQAMERVLSAASAAVPGIDLLPAAHSSTEAFACPAELSIKVHAVTKQPTADSESASPQHQHATRELVQFVSSTASGMEEVADSIESAVHDIFESSNFKVKEDENIDDGPHTHPGIGLVCLSRVWMLFRLGLPPTRSLLSTSMTWLCVFGFLVATAGMTAVLLDMGNAATLGDKLSQNDTGGAVHYLILTVLYVCVNACAFSISGWAFALAGLQWRRRLTHALQKEYLCKSRAVNVCYVANTMDPALDNVDQRICADITLQTTAFMEVVFGSSAPKASGTANNNGLILSLAQVGIMMYAVIDTTGWFPMTVVVSVSLASCLLSGWLSQRVSRASALRQKAEGSFRFFHGRLRCFAESVAFFDGERQESAASDALFHQLYVVIRKSYMRSAALLMGFVFFYRQIVALGAYLTVAGAVFLLDVDLEPGSNSTVAGVTRVVTQVINTTNFISQIPALCLQLSLLVGVVHRVARLHERLVSIGSSPVFEYAAAHTVESDNTSELVASHLTLAVPTLDERAPRARPLFTDLSFTIAPGNSLAIMGPSGCGKSSLLRALAGVWPIQGGSLARPLKISVDGPVPSSSHHAHDRITLEEEEQEEHSSSASGKGQRRVGLFFVPQRPFVTAGSLRDQLVYPLSVHEAATRLPAYTESQLTAVENAAHGTNDLTADNHSHSAALLTVAGNALMCDEDEENGDMTPLDTLLARLLRAVRLSHLLDHRGLDACAPWRDMLSLGEQQRLGLARLFFHHPKIALLDEATSALDMDSENATMRLCVHLEISLVSVTHRPSVLPHHQQLLYITPQGAPDAAGRANQTCLIDLTRGVNEHTSLSSPGQDGEQVLTKE